MKHTLILCLSLLVSAPAYAGSVTAKSTLVRGTIVKANDVRVDAEYDENAEQLLAEFVGLQVKRTIYAGQTLAPTSVGAPVLIKRNSRVTMIYRFGPMEITAFGRALEEGGEGDVVTIMNLDSRQKVTGIVKRAGFVEVTL